MNYTEVEAKVREATNDEAWGPHGTLMHEIAEHTYQYEHYSEVMGMLWKRMFQDKKNWRSTYKVRNLACLIKALMNILIFLVIVIVKLFD